ncbi:MAG: hypothetical protein WC242_00205 [Candidatus Paceibacterota bacterium]
MKLLTNIWRRITGRNLPQEFYQGINVNLIGTMPDTRKNDPNLTSEEMALRAKENREKIERMFIESMLKREKILHKTTFHTPYSRGIRYKAAA